MVDEVVLVAPAISPGYDLSAALRHVRQIMYVFTSTGDWFELGLGTNTLGTIDGIKCQAAGRFGFAKSVGADAAAYRKLVQFPYDPAWMRYLNFGNHTGAMSPSFARHVLAPMLVMDERSKRLARGSLDSAAAKDSRTATPSSKQQQDRARTGA